MKHKKYTKNNVWRISTISIGTLLLVAGFAYFSVATEPQIVHASPPVEKKKSDPNESISERINIQKDSDKTVPVSPEPQTTAPTSVTQSKVEPSVISGSEPLQINKSMALYADPLSSVASQARAWSASYPNDAAKMNRLAETPMAKWFGGWSGDVRVAANNYVSAATNAGQIPTLIAYNIPQRDCGSYSAGGLSNASAYKSWIDDLAVGIGQRKAIVIIEPDALAGMDCLNEADQQTRLDLISYAVQAVRNQSQAAIYIDAGHATWHSADVMANRLKAANISSASGFSLNISNFQSTSASTSYGASISSRVGNKHFVIDTSRNGNGPATGDMAWCNPDGRSFGDTPTLQTGSAGVDAYLWLKSPGESDGTCGSSQNGVAPPPAGSWWPQYVLMLANNSKW